MVQAGTTRLRPHCTATGSNFSPDLQANPGGLVEVRGHQRVPQGKVEGREECRLLHTDHVKETRNALRPGREGVGGESSDEIP